VDNVQEQDENGEARDNAGMPRRSRRSPRHNTNFWHLLRSLLSLFVVTSCKR
jgi:hypothetical protein